MLATWAAMARVCSIQRLGRPITAVLFKRAAAPAAAASTAPRPASLWSHGAGFGFVSSQKIMLLLSSWRPCASGACTRPKPATTTINRMTTFKDLLQMLPFAL